MDGRDPWYCPSVVILSDYLEVRVIVAVKALSYCLMFSGEVIITVQAVVYFLVYVRCGSLLLSKCCYTFWCM